jgi:hypothetical protein
MRISRGRRSLRPPDFILRIRERQRPADPRGSYPVPSATLLGGGWRQSFTHPGVDHAFPDV